MAEVRYRLGRGAYDFAHKICKRYLMESQNKQGKSAIKTSSLSAWFLLGDIQNGELYGGENAADRATVGVSQDSCTRSNTKFRRTSCTFTSARQQQSPGSRRDGQLVFIRTYSGNGTQSEPLYKTKTGYYEILEVTPTATQVQIKTAYYKQSFTYHPDRNTGEEATVRFSEISEAYTVLGNKELRKKYDRGLLSQSDLIATVRPSAKGTTGSSKQTESRRSAVGGDSRGGVFDFDQFFKDHYNAQLQKGRDIRVRKEEMLRRKEETIGEKKLGGMMEMGVGLMLALAMAILMSL